MKVSRDEFFSRAASVGVDPAQAAALWAELEKQEHASAPGAAFTAANVAYYLGGAIVICAMTFFMVQVWSNDAEIVALALCYMVLLGAIGGWLYRRPETRRPGGILVTAATSLTPLLVYGLIKLSGGWTKANDPARTPRSTRSSTRAGCRWRSRRSSSGSWPCASCGFRS